MKYLLTIISLLLLLFNITIVQATTIICIAGGTGAGKTSIAKKLKEQMSDEVEIISEDSYYRDLSHLEKEERKKINFDHPNAIEFTLLKKHLLELKKGKSVAVPTYDFSDHNRTKIVNTVTPKKITILEGILLLSVPEIRDLADIKVFVDVADDVRLLRRIERDIEERGRAISDIQKQYLTAVKPMHQKFVVPSKEFADIIIPHGSKNSIAINLLLTQIHKILATGEYSIYTTNNDTTRTSTRYMGSGISGQKK